MLRKLKWQIPGELLAAQYNWCQGPVPGHGLAVEKHWYKENREALLVTVKEADSEVHTEQNEVYVYAPWTDCSTKSM